ncbi:hypothetical protein ADK67_26030 [Saccharothrix sp. NRRL B-16348]|nr:hypothetical protein ADK67_26030 [Saccharothrix sp. NRRL B-16348]
MWDNEERAVPVPVHLHEALDGLVLNPALPADLVGRLLRYRRGLGHVAKRSDLTEDLIAEIIDADWFWLVHSLALNSSLPDTFRMRLARHPHPLVRTAVVVGSDDGTPREVFELLIDDPDPTVRGYLAESGHVPEDLRAALAADPDPKIRATLAQWWTDAPEQVRRTLLTDPVPDVRAAACSTYYARLPHPVPPPDLVPALLADPVTRAGAIRHAALDHATAAQLAQDPAPDVRKQVAAHPQLPPELRDTLAADPNASVRVVIFGRADTPEPLRAAIHAGIQALSAQPDTLQGLDADDPARKRNLDNYTARIELRYLKLDWVTADPLSHVDSPYPCFRASAAACASLPPDVVTRLLNDVDIDVVTTMVRHAPHLVDLATAERVARQFRPDRPTAWHPADDFTFPPDVLRRFAVDPDPGMRRLAPRDPELPAALAQKLATDPDHSVRHAVANHRNLPTPALIGLLSDENESVAHAAAGSPYLPTEQMERLLALADL